ncbi:TonB-dependent receptor [Alteromonas sp. C1M14]|nr:TonB-dependent receptor [Alteromonas sp. C1M14]
MLLFSGCLVTSANVIAHGFDIEQIEVVGRQTRLIGDAIAASSGIIGQDEIASRPLLRTGEMMELVPGMVVTQHSGSGKANQYFLRGFNLDHGTDFSTSVNGMPINMRSHGHGQGYTDLNFITPEFVHHISYNKGAYSALQGDFSTAGSASMSLISTLPKDIIAMDLGQDNYVRAVAGKSFHSDASSVFIGGELNTYDGPWSDIDEDVEKVNGLFNVTTKTNSGTITVTAMAYDNSWNSADQIPTRAVESGLIDELGSLDTSVGGDSSRYSLSTNITIDDFYVSAYAIDSDLDLFSNFTYFLSDPINGDQFEQVDKRQIYGAEAGYHFSASPTNMDWTHLIGMQVRVDDIGEVGLHHTQNRVRLSTVRDDTIDERSFSYFYQGDLLLNSRTTLRLGARYDYFDVNVNSDTPENSGSKDDGIASFSAGLSYIFSTRIEGYINAGQSFHSNDARGATLSVDPETGEEADPVDLLVKGNTAEMGLRYFTSKALNISASLWYLTLDSELLYVGDAGNNEASRASRRYGAELAAYYWFNDTFNADLEVALTHSRFKGNEEGEGNHITGALGEVISAGLTWKFATNWDSSVRLRHFGPRALDSYGDVESSSLTVVNAQVNWQRESWAITFQALNLFDSDDHDIDYLYESQLQTETTAVEDVHYHPIEPRTLRVKVAYTF